MTLIDELFDIEREAYKKSTVHALDARVKLVLCLAGLLATVLLPFTGSDAGIVPWKQIFAFAVIFLLFIALYVMSGASLRYYLVRMVVILPLALFFIILQPFFTNPYFTVYHVLFSIGPVHVYLESIVFGVSLFLKFIISLSFIILLSATTTMQDLVIGASRMYVPRIFTTAMTLTIRYIFVFARIFMKMQSAFSARCFYHAGRGLPLSYRLTTIGNAAGTLFVRALDQGERTYLAMCCRGYGDESGMFVEKKPLSGYEWLFLAGGIVYLIFFPVSIYLLF
ncbi:MAG TPA: cobalt ECF transporter T component CbiQ [Methanocorpusculum sp.]|nr:cobalt ECF transporter T component CbiQ [Methanocorpusculum sp.]